MDKKILSYRLYIASYMLLNDVNVIYTIHSILHVLQHYEKYS